MRLNGIAKVVCFLFLAVSIYGYTAGPGGTDSLPVYSEDQGVRDSIIKIYTSFNQYDHQNPWSKLGPRQKYGSGAIIQLPDSGQRVVLTNSHVISAHTYIEGRKNGQTDRYKLKPLWVSHELDLALLVPFHDHEKALFFSGTTPIPLGKVPPLQTDLMLLGYPIGGDTISATKGVLSRLEYQPYSNSGFSFLAGQIDAASNPGNSGGPAVVNGEIIGVLMQGYSPFEASNIAHIVPVNIIRHFLQDITDGHYSGIPSLGIETEELENGFFKTVYGVKENKGVLVRHVIPGSAADGVLQPDDVILELDGHGVGHDKTIVFRGSERVSMDYVVHSRQVGEELRVRVIRNKQILDLLVTLTQPVNNDLLLGVDGQSAPSYFIYQGLVFTKVTRELLMGAGHDLISYAGLTPLLLNNFRFADEDEVVVILKVLPHEANRGYHNIFLRKVDSVGSEKVKNLRQLVDLIESEEQDFLEFNTGYKGLEKIVLNTHLADMVNAEVMWLNGIQHDRSKNLRINQYHLAGENTQKIEDVMNVQRLQHYQEMISG
ncbi:S1C family serine protease [Endozoicomonas sp. SCSIO W0465]|uniref:S1C family serine protease n=1 Tax=Endozoicomonas sp. SCSIO W0465 TaxID=2918516 RepID=UPI0020760E4F|nr:S1C family serine protease [Endozoicomonas sp. SCSIO W0465]USE38437.1 serine protease [Endozoicomonas sp. SCSIO W0465]